jgi:predicted ATP-grasp superfamily ATP-dependent carboligase
VRALIIDSGLDRGSLAAVRALAAAGWTVGTGSPEPGLAAWSRHCRAHHHVPSPSEGTERMVEATARAVAEGGYEVVFSSDDEGVLALSEHREAVGAAVGYADHPSVLRAFDKLELSRAAEASGLAVPRWKPASETALSDWPGPVVLKPRLTFAPGSTQRLNTRVLDDSAAAREPLAEIEAAGGQALLQEVIRGGLLAQTVLADRDARVIARVQQRAVMTWPPDVGVSARAVTVTPEAELSSAVDRLIEELGWFGLAQLQLLRGEDGRPRLLDFNGRFYGSLALALAAGLNLPAAWAQLATGRPLAPLARAAAGCRYQWFSRDLRASRAASGSWAGALTDSLPAALGASHSVWRADDPWPALRHYGGGVMEEAWEWIRRSSSTR